MKTNKKLLLMLLMSCMGRLFSMEDEKVLENLMSLENLLEVSPFPLLDDEIALDEVDGEASTDYEPTDDDDCSLSYKESSSGDQVTPSPKLLNCNESDQPGYVNFSYDMLTGLILYTEHAFWDKQYLVPQATEQSYKDEQKSTGFGVQDSLVITCTLCSTTFNTQRKLDNHYETAHPKQCPTCGLTCKYKRDLSDHISVVHEGKIFSCACGRTYRKRNALYQHGMKCEKYVKRKLKNKKTK